LNSARLARKQATRERVLEAARNLFVEIGYEAATVRMIAARAGVAIGSVFTTFASKRDILREVMEERLQRLYAELDLVVPHLRGATQDRLCSIMAVHYEFEMQRPRLFTAYISASFDWSDVAGLPVFGRNLKLKGMIRDVLEHGVRVGEVRKDADLDVFVEILVSTYGFNYRRAAQQGHDAAALIASMDRQIVVMFEGVAA
jgi:AcrR family transcriptional regulator